MTLNWRFGGTRDEWGGRSGGVIVRVALLSLSSRRPSYMQAIPEGFAIRMAAAASDYLSIDIRHGRRRYGLRLYRWTTEFCGPSIRCWWGLRKWPRRILWGAPPPMGHEGEQLHAAVAERYFNPKPPPLPDQDPE